jgi:PAS domain S-box-containing protein
MEEKAGGSLGARIRERLTYSPPVVIVTVACSAFFIEIALMVGLEYLPKMSAAAQTILDASLLTMFMVPILVAVVFRPLVKHRDNLEGLVAERTVQLREAIHDLVEEIAERKRTAEALSQSEERFRQLLDQAEDAIILFRPGTCRIIDMNPRAERFYGYTKPELNAFPRFCFISNDSEKERLRELISALKEGETFEIEKAGHVRKDGAPVTVSIKGKVIFIQNVALVYCTFRDITTRARLEEEARIIQSKLIQANKMASLGVLVSGIAHEINNPNNFILGNSELVAKAWKDTLPVLREYREENGDFQMGGIPSSLMEGHVTELVSGISEGARRIRDIINNMKMVARDEKLVSDASVDVNRVVTLAMTLLSHQIDKHTSRFETLLAEGLPAVRGSRQQLEQVVINLIMNGLQALPDRSKGMRIATLLDGDGGVAIEVRDEGCGIAPDIAERVLDPFFTTKLDSGGTGLGLSISYSIVKEHQGTLELHSEPGEGTVFTIRLPAAPGKGENHAVE